MFKIKPKGKLMLFLALASAMIWSVGCGSNATGEKVGEVSPEKSQEGTASPKKGGTITISLPVEPDRLDEQTASTVGELIESQIGGGLLTVDPVTKEIKPHLAESYSISEDGKAWTFKIRPNVKIQDGTPVTSSVFKETYDRILENKGGAVTALLSSIQSISTPDDQTLIFHLKEASAPLLSNLAYYSGALMPQSTAAVQKLGKDYSRNPLGVGPWKFESWQAGQAVTLVRNDEFNWAQPFYENQGPVRPDKLVFKFIKDKQTALAALESGAIDIASNVSPKDAKKFKDNPNYTILEEQKSGIGNFLAANTKSEIVKDVLVRKALNMAVNKEAIIQAVLQGEGVVANGPLPVTMFGYDRTVEEYGYPYNPEEAKKLLDTAGWKDDGQGGREKDGQKLAIRLFTDDENKQSAQLVQSMMAAVGVKITIESMVFATILDKCSKGDYDLAIFSYVYPDPDVLYLFFHSSQLNGLNYGKVHDPELDSLLEKGRSATDAEARKTVYAQIQKNVIEQAYWVPIYTEKQFHVMNNRVKGVKVAAGRWYLNDSWVAE